MRGDGLGLRGRGGWQEGEDKRGGESGLRSQSGRPDEEARHGEGRGCEETGWGW